MSFRPNPFHADYILNVCNMSYRYLNNILFKPTQFMEWTKMSSDDLSCLVTAVSVYGFFPVTVL